MSNIEIQKDQPGVGILEEGGIVLAPERFFQRSRKVKKTVKLDSAIDNGR